jgi:biotin carboxyl carrier protein
VKRFTATSEKNQFIIDTSPQGLHIDGKPCDVLLETLPVGFHRLLIDDKSFNVFCKQISETQFEIWLDHFIIDVSLDDDRSQILRQINNVISSNADSMVVKAPMPGLVTAIEVQLGDIVKPGKGLFVLEAMKMENEIRSTVHGRVKSIEVKNRMTVEKNQKLLVLEPIR